LNCVWLMRRSVTSSRLKEIRNADEEEETSRPKPTPEWMEEVLRAHNTRREMHWTPPLVWSEMCYEYAQRQVDACMTAGSLSHGLTDCVQGRLGQCILAGSWKKDRNAAIEQCVRKWYDEIARYKFDCPGHRKESKNFEQVIWFATTSVGMAVSKDGKYAVANYYPAGPDSLLEPPGEKGRRLYFPPGCDVESMTNNEKCHRWFQTNVLPLKDGPPPWLGPVGIPGMVPEEERQPSRSPSRESRRPPSTEQKKMGKLPKSNSRRSLAGSKSRAKSLSKSLSQSQDLAPARKSSGSPSSRKVKALVKEAT